MTAAKSTTGRFFEDFRLGQEIAHATPRTVTAGDVAFYTALYGGRFAAQSAATFARAIGYPSSPVDDLLIFHIVFGKTVPDISLNAVANLGYAECRFLRPVYVGDTLAAKSTVIGLRENANRKTGVVYVRSVGTNQDGDGVLDYVRWVMVRKRDEASPAPEPALPTLADHVAPEALCVADGLRADGYDTAAAGGRHLWDDYAPGERIDHVDGVTIEEAEHQLATRLFQNTARAHFDALAAADSRFGKRIVYGGHVMSTARALSFNGLQNAFAVAAINGGSHTAPAFAGDTLYAWSEVLDKSALGGREDVGALRVRTVAVKNAPARDFPDRDSEGRYHPAVALDLDYWILIPRH